MSCAPPCSKTNTQRPPGVHPLSHPGQLDQTFKFLSFSTRAAGITDADRAEAFVGQLVDPALHPAVTGEPTTWLS